MTLVVAHHESRVQDVGWTPARPVDAFEGAPCRGSDPELWFPTKNEKHKAQAAKALCRSCPLLAACLELCLSMGQPQAGIWAATTERERRGMKPTQPQT